MNPARPQKLNKFIVGDYFSKLRDTFAELNIMDKPQNVFNIDEKGCRLTIHYEKSVLTQRGQKHVLPRQNQSSRQYPAHHPLVQQALVYQPLTLSLMRRHLRSCLPTPINQKEKVTTIRRKALNYKGQRVTKQIFTSAETKQRPSKKGKNYE